MGAVDEFGEDGFVEFAACFGDFPDQWFVDVAGRKEIGGVKLLDISPALGGSGGVDTDFSREGSEAKCTDWSGLWSCSCDFNIVVQGEVLSTCFVKTIERLVLVDWVE